jgi:hypothetical protein
MDYHQFKTYEKVTNTSGFPRTRQEQGLFLLELSFSPEEETHSLNVPLMADFSAFGDVVSLHLQKCSTYLSAPAMLALQDTLKPSEPPLRASYDPLTDDLAVHFLKNPAVRTRAVAGSFIFDSHRRLVTLVARLRG